MEVEEGVGGVGVVGGVGGGTRIFDKLTHPVSQLASEACTPLAFNIGRVRRLPSSRLASRCDDW